MKMRVKPKEAPLTIKDPHSSLRERISGCIDRINLNQQIVSRLKEKYTFKDWVYTSKLNVASDRIPMDTNAYYLRCASILKKLVENPAGINKLRNWYSKLKRNKVRPPTRFRASYGVLKEMINFLKSQGLIISHSKGLTTSEKGKNLIRQCLDKVETQII